MKQRKCPYCGNMTDDADFCQVCGRRIVMSNEQLRRHRETNFNRFMNIFIIFVLFGAFALMLLDVVNVSGWDTINQYTPDANIGFLFFIKDGWRKIIYLFITDILTQISKLASLTGVFASLFSGETLSEEQLQSLTNLLPLLFKLIPTLICFFVLYGLTIYTFIKICVNLVRGVVKCGKGIYHNTKCEGLTYAYKAILNYFIYFIATEICVYFLYGSSASYAENNYYVSVTWAIGPKIAIALFSVTLIIITIYKAFLAYHPNHKLFSLCKVFSGILLPISLLMGYYSIFSFKVANTDMSPIHFLLNYLASNKFSTIIVNMIVNKSITANELTQLLSVIIISVVAILAFSFAIVLVKANYKPYYKKKRRNPNGKIITWSIIVSVLFIGVTLFANQAIVNAYDDIEISAANTYSPYIIYTLILVGIIFMFTIIIAILNKKANKKLNREKELLSRE